MAPKDKWSNAVKNSKTYNLLAGEANSGKTSPGKMVKQTEVKVDGRIVPVEYDKDGTAYLFIDGSASAIPKGSSIPDYIREQMKKGMRVDSYGE